MEPTPPESQEDEIEIKKASEVDGKPLSFTSPKTTPSGNKEDSRLMSRERERERVDIKESINKLIASGAIKSRTNADAVDINDPDLRQDFGRLLYMGAPMDLVCRVLCVSTATYTKLKRMHLEASVDALGEVGVVGMVAQAFDKLEFASNRSLQLIAALGNQKEDRADLIAAINTLKAIESEKVNLLVRTGAIKIKRKVEISTHLESGTSQKELYSGGKAQQVMLDIVASLGDINESDEDDDSSQA